MRKLSDKSMEQDKLDLILEMGRATPTAYNSQPQKILVLNILEEMELLTKCCPFRSHQTLASVACYEKEVGWERRDYDSVDSDETDMGIVGTRMILQASELGIGSTQVMHLDPQAVHRKFRIPEALVPMAILMMGYPRKDVKPSRLHGDRFGLSKAVFYHTFQGWRWD